MNKDKSLWTSWDADKLVKCPNCFGEGKVFIPVPNGTGVRLVPCQRRKGKGEVLK